MAEILWIVRLMIIAFICIFGYATITGLSFWSVIVFFIVFTLGGLVLWIISPLK